MNKNLNEALLNLARPEILEMTPYASARSSSNISNSSILNENRFSGLAPIDPSSLEFPRGAAERATGMYKDIHEDCERRRQQSGKPKCEGYSNNCKQPTELIYLNANENNYLLPGYENLNLHRYPEAAQPANLLQKISELYSVEPGQIIITRGSDEAIDLLIRTFCRAYQDKILICPPTFGMYEVYATIHGAGIVTTPLLKEQNFKLDTTNLLQTWQSTIKLVFLCSPNNPTGNLLEKNDIIKICETLKDQALVIVDEAYIEFANAPSLVSIMCDYPNLVILRTLSKLYGLAGIRCGVAIAHPTVIYLLQKVLAPYPLPITTIEAVYQHLTPTNLSAINNTRELLIKEREKMYSFFQNQTFVKRVWPSDTNFLLVEVNDANDLVAHCETHGIIIRDRSNDYDLANCVRISIGTAAENQLLRDILK